MIITTDTSSLLSPDNNEIRVLPVSLCIDGKTYKDYIDINTDQFTTMINNGAIATTSQPAIGDLLDIYENTDEDILTITVADGLSGTYMNAIGAKNSSHNPDRIHVVNSKSLAGCLMYIVNKADSLRRQGLSMTDIKDQLSVSIDSSVSFIIPDNFSFLARSGRLTPIAAKIGSMLKIVPVLTQTKDRLRIEPFCIKRTMNKAVSSVISYLKEHINNQYIIYVLHTDARDLADKTSAQLKDIFKDNDIEILELSPSLSTHGGPGCIVIQAIMK